MIYTPEEIAELKARPVGDTQWRGFTEEQLVLRVSIAQKCCDHFNKIDSTMPEWARTISEKVPNWGFYLDSGANWPPRRVYGTCLGPNKEECVHAATLVAGLNNDVTGGISICHLRRVDRWPADVVERMRNGMYSNIGLWEDPLGFLPIIYSLAPDPKGAGTQVPEESGPSNNKSS